MLKIDSENVKKNRFPIALLAVQLTIALLAVYIFYKLLGFNFDLETKVLSVAPAFDPILAFFLALAILLLIALNFTVKKRLPELFQAQELAKGTIKEKTIEKVSKVKSDPRAAALLLIEIMFVIAIVITIIAWLDPGLELIPWSRVGIAPPLTTALNAVIAVIALAFFYYLYSFTAWYRK